MVNARIRLRLYVYVSPLFRYMLLCLRSRSVCFRALSQRGGLPVLEHLNLSGCLFITGVGLQELVSVCPSLNDEHFYYCDNINGNTSATQTKNCWIGTVLLSLKCLISQKEDCWCLTLSGCLNLSCLLENSSTKANSSCSNSQYCYNQK